MSKKPQPQNKDSIKNKLQIVDQQNQPFLKALQKKVRNISKKLTQISELQSKDNLKPEQIQKINRKDSLLEERTKLQQTALLYKQTYAENAAFYRNLQLKEFQALSRALAIYHSGSKVADSDKLAALWGIIEQSDKLYSTLNETINAIYNSLKDFSNDRKLQKNLTAHVQQHGNNVNGTIEVNQEKIVNQICEEKHQTKAQEVPVKQVSHPKVVEQVKAPVAPEPPKVQAPCKKVEVVAEVVAQPAETKPIVQEKASEPVKHVEPARKENEKRRDYPLYDRPYRRNADYKPREPKQPKEPREGDDKGGNEGRKYNNEKKNYKPKYEEKGQQLAKVQKAEQAEQAEQVSKRDNSGSSSSSSPESRNFRKDEIRKLEEDGFIVVGKPKLKARDQQNVYDHQHGKKFRHHLTANV